MGQFNTKPRTLHWRIYKNYLYILTTSFRCIYHKKPQPFGCLRYDNEKFREILQNKFLTINWNLTRGIDHTEICLIDIWDKRQPRVVKDREIKELINTFVEYYKITEVFENSKEVNNIIYH